MFTQHTIFIFFLFFLLGLRSSCLIWQIISFILPPNVFVCLFALLSGPAIDLQKMPILEKKNHLFRWSSFWSLRVCKRAKFSHLGHRKPARIHWKAARIFEPCFWRSHYQPQSWCHLATSELTPLDYYLWRAVKPETIGALRNNIREAIGEIQLNTINKVLKNFTDSVGYCMASRVSNLNEIIFDY